MKRISLSLLLSTVAYTSLHAALPSKPAASRFDRCVQHILKRHEWFMSMSPEARKFFLVVLPDAQQKQVALGIAKIQEQAKEKPASASSEVAVAQPPRKKRRTRTPL